MTLIEPVRNEVANPRKVKKYPASLRSWHWLNAVVICGSLITVLINSTVMDRGVVTPVVVDELKDKGVSISAQQAQGIGHALGDKVWEVHTWFGYLLAALLLFRLAMEFFQLADQKFIRKLKSAYQEFKIVKQNRELARHELAVKTIYAVFYLLMIIMVFTGLFLAFEDWMAPYKSIRHSVKEVHGFCMYLIIAFIVIHLAGVFLAERKNSPGIVSDMINGGGGAI